MPDPNLFHPSFEPPRWRSREEATLDLTGFAEATCELPEPLRPWGRQHIGSVETSMLGRLTAEVPKAREHLNRAAHMTVEVASPTVRATVMAMVAALLSSVEVEAARLGKVAERSSLPWRESDVRHKLSKEIESAVKHAPAAFLIDVERDDVRFLPDRWVQEAFAHLVAAAANAPSLGPSAQALVNAAARGAAGSVRRTGRHHLVDDAKQNAWLKALRALHGGLELQSIENVPAFGFRLGWRDGLSTVGREVRHDHAPVEDAEREARTLALGETAGRVDAAFGDEGVVAVVVRWLEANVASLVEDTENVIALDKARKRSERLLPRTGWARKICDAIGLVSFDDAPAVAEELEALRDRIGADRTKSRIQLLRLTTYAALLVADPDTFPWEVEKQNGEWNCAALAEEAPGKAVYEWIDAVLRPRLEAAFGEWDAA